MHTLLAFIEFVLGFVPFIVTILVIATALWAATKLFPTLGSQMSELMDRLFGVDADYDEKYNTGYASTTPSRETHLDTYC